MMNGRRLAARGTEKSAYPAGLHPFRFVIAGIDYAKIEPGATRDAQRRSPPSLASPSGYKGGEAERIRSRYAARAISSSRNSRNTGDHLACSGPLDEWPRSLSISK